MFKNILSILRAYSSPPNGMSTIPELEEICKERSALYRIMSKRKQYKEGDYVKKEMEDRNLKTYLRLLDGSFTEEDQQRNWRAHWLMTMYYCKSLHTKEYFIDSELAWFSILYTFCSYTDIDQFMKHMGWKPGSVTGRECPFFLDFFDEDQKLCHVPFQEAPPEFLVDGIAALHKGIAYFPEQFLESYLRHRLKVEWSNRCDRFAEMSSDFPDNVKHLFNSMVEDLSGSFPIESSSASDLCNVSLENIDDFAESHYPLCMRHIHNVLRTNHHLKYDCKMQYGIFLKHIGFPFEDALSFWREEFTKVIPEHLYNSKYEYLFKHQYGKVGGRINYPPRSCDEIQNSHPMLDQHHGCPFKHWDMDSLREVLSNERITGSNLVDIEDLVKTQQYRHACKMYFCIKHHVLNAEDINSPNGYFNQSVQFNLLFDNGI